MMENHVEESMKHDMEPGEYMVLSSMIRDTL